MSNVLVLDANQRSALAATRSLGRRGVHVVAADSTSATLAGASRYCSGTFAYPSPAERALDFIEVVKAETASRDIRIILPITEVTTSLVLEHRGDFSNVIIPGPSFAAFELLSDKYRLFKLAQELHIPIPTTYFIDEKSQVAPILETLRFPIVLKPYRSRVRRGGQFVSTAVKYSHNVDELRQIIAGSDIFGQYPFLIQEYIRGESQGVFALYQNGRPLVFFSHRRLREKPPWGGVSVLSESTELNTTMKDYAARLLEHAGWHGVAMVEFKVSHDGVPYLMEVNPRFWGSLQLAIDAGVDFPYLLFLMAMGEPLPEVGRYRIGVRTRWLLGDLDRLYLVLKQRRNASPIHRFPKFRAILDFLRFLQRDTHYEVNRWGDLRPAWIELKQYCRPLMT